MYEGALGHNRRFLPAAQRLKAMIAAGELGTLLHIEGNISGPGALAWRRLIAPQERSVVAFGRFESAWPVLGIVLHDGVAIASAGRVSTMDDGLWIVGLDPATGARRWQARNVQHPVQQKRDAAPVTAADVPGLEGAVKHPAYAYMPLLTVNAPPRIVDGKVRLLGRPGIDPQSPRDLNLFESLRIPPPAGR